jgi:tRNA (guanine-N7-)-methyltransferase
VSPDRRVDPATWEAPAPPDAGAAGVRGALGGSRLLDRPEHADLRRRVEDFVAGPGPLILEIGVDHGVVLIESARLHPGVRWLGCEVRRGHVERAAPHAPDNALLVRLDGRTLLDGVVPPGRLEGVVVLFPSPSHDPRHLLLTPTTRDLVAAALSPTGRLHVATDVPGMARWVDRLLDGWPEAEPLPLAPALSRRDRVCRRDGIEVWRTTRAAPEASWRG